VAKKPAKAKPKAAKLKRQRKLDDLDKFKPGELNKLTLGDFKLGTRRVPWSAMSPDERRQWEAAIEYLKRPSRWADEVWGSTAGKELDRAMAEERRGPSLPPSTPPPKKTKKRAKAVAPAWRPRVHDYSILKRIARDVAKTKPKSVKGDSVLAPVSAKPSSKPVP
jgi:hypothetical protein